VERSYLLASSPNRIGSVRQDNDIVLQVRGVSRHHARVSLQKGELTLEDLGSKNGTLANGVRIQRTRIEPGDRIGVGPVTLRLEEIDPDDARVVFVPDPVTPPATPASRCKTQQTSSMAAPPAGTGFRSSRACSPG
jgi:pSer/pThr/pTyr-binding forkhead associated (FHA) protein